MLQELSFEQEFDLVLDSPRRAVDLTRARLAAAGLARVSLRATEATHRSYGLGVVRLVVGAADPAALASCHRHVFRFWQPVLLDRRPDCA